MESAQLAHELQRGGTDFVVSYGWFEIEQRSDVSAHDAMNDPRRPLCLSIQACVSSENDAQQSEHRGGAGERSDDNDFQVRVAAIINRLDPQRRAVIARRCRGVAQVRCNVVRGFLAYGVDLNDARNFRAAMPRGGCAPGMGADDRLEVVP